MSESQYFANALRQDDDRHQPDDETYANDEAHCDNMPTSGNSNHPAFVSNDPKYTETNGTNRNAGDNYSPISSTARMPRHSLPSSMSKGYVARVIKKKKTMGSMKKRNPNIIHEDEVKEFEGSHCNDGIPDGHGQANLISPPVKFYKQNSNPYPAFRNDDQLMGDSSGGIPVRKVQSLENVPVKPKRLLLRQQNAQKNTKELAEAHFNGSYKNYEVRSPYYESRTHAATAATSADMKRAVENRLSGSSGRFSPQYHTIRNKHGELVEYAVPYCEQDEFGADSQDMPTDNQFDNEVFQEDFQECEKLINENFHFLTAERNANNTAEGIQIQETDSICANASRTSLYNKKRRKLNENVIVTDLDKSVESAKTFDGKRQSNDIFDELNSLSKWSENLSKNAEPKTKSQCDLLELFHTVKTSMPCCRIKELKSKSSVLRNTFDSPIDIVSGVFRKTVVTFRNYSMNDCDQKDESVLIAEEAIKRDFEIMRWVAI